MEAKILNELNEKEILNKKKRIVKLHRQFQIEDNYVLVFERLGRSLKEELGRRDFSLEETKHMAHQILNQLCFIHRKGVIHTDLKL